LGQTSRGALDDRAAVAPCRIAEHHHGAPPQLVGGSPNPASLSNRKK